ncbi:ribonuclease H-like domain-containing protein [Tanacetum coccineum]|uniref:Ribonuclease H-like domain-containing protein n=1 Tax=Tanacetum coccineum TaxID=301880 RepID=A0ABQ4Y812_9ASTR
MRPFWCHVTILNTLDYLGKFDGKSDEGFFVGYSLNSKAFRINNIRTRKVEENLHIRFLEDKPIIAGDGPKWLFDIDVLTKSMNYMPVVAGTNSNDLVDGLLFDSSSKNASNNEPQSSSDAGKKDDEGVNKESGINGKADEGFFVGYLINSKAFRVFNNRTKIVEENMHVQFSENTPNIAGSGPNWLFDIDALTKSMNYKPIVVGNQSNDNAGTKACDDACKARREIVPGKDYILLPL